MWDVRPPTYSSIISENMNGKFIVIDGIDGSGKATQAKLLVQKFKDSGKDVEYFSFPQYENNFFGKIIRQYLAGDFGKPTEIHPRLASILYAADRWESAGKIQRWLSAGKIIVVDRYYTSNLIHQGAKLPPDELDKFIDWVHQLEFDIFKIPKPDMVIYLHVPATMACQLITARGQGHDGHENLKHLQVAEQRCLYLADRLGWTKIECCDKLKLLLIEEISAKIWVVVNKGGGNGLHVDRVGQSTGAYSL